MISFKDLQSGKTAVTKVAELLQSRFTAQELVMLPRLELAYRALAILNFKNLENTEASVKAYAQKTLKSTPFSKNAEDPIKVFLTVFLNISNNLLQVKSKLELEAGKHLAEIEALSVWYESLPFITGYKANPIHPRDNEQYKQLEFYRRTLSKKKQVTEYLIHGIYRIALEKSRRNTHEMEVNTNIQKTFAMLERYRDFPYLDFCIGQEVTYDIDMSRIDFRLINPVINKSAWLGKESYKQIVYSDGLDKKIEQVLEAPLFMPALIEQLKSIPIICQREPIFMEMQQLLCQKSWYALYALALFQVEGLFGEMLTMLDRKKSNGSLTKKVNSLRSFHASARYTFDYYEFTLSDIRNSFAHTGKVIDPQHKCYRLLLDIAYLLNVFSDLNAPLIRLSKLTAANNDGITHIGHLSSIITLINSLTREELAMIRPQVDRFFYKKFIPGIDQRHFFRALQNDMNFALFQMNELTQVVAYEFFDESLFISVTSAQARLDAIQKTLDTVPVLIDEHFKLLSDTQTFMFGFAKTFPKTPKSFLKKIEAFKREFDAQFKVIHYLKPKIKLEMDDKFLLQEKYYQHIPIRYKTKATVIG